MPWRSRSRSTTPRRIRRLGRGIETSSCVPLGTLKNLSARTTPTTTKNSLTRAVPTAPRSHQVNTRSQRSQTSSPTETVFVFRQAIFLQFVLRRATTPLILLTLSRFRPLLAGGVVRPDSRRLRKRYFQNCRRFCNCEHPPSTGFIQFQQVSHKGFNSNHLEKTSIHRSQ